jgi:uncharacterized membrane protein YdjX (TVP38/TMEM64 family)
MNEASSDETRPAPARRTAWRALPLLLLALALGAFFLFDGARYVSFEKLGQVQHALKARVAAQPVLAALAYIAAYAVVVAASLPVGAYATILGGLLFGPVFGTAFAAIGATMGASLLFLAARTALGGFLRKRAGPAIARMEAGFRANAFSYLLALRLVPLFPFWLVNLVPAFFGIRLVTYIAATLLGILPATFVFAGIGHGLGAVLAQGRTPNLSVLTKPELLLPLLGLALLALLPVVFKRLKARKAHG